nr:ATP-dependent Clp protease proteolytic subunit [Fundidesulfovibrio soli]
MSDYGIVFLTGGIDSGTSQSVCERIIECNVSGEIDHMQLIINSHGGEVSAGFAIIDVMEWSRIPIYTTGLGMLASMGLMVFMAGEPGRRVLTPRTSILSHRFQGIRMGSHGELIAGRKGEDLTHERILDHYLRYSKMRTREQAEETLLKEVDIWVSAEEAIEYGLADIVETPRRRGGHGGR